MQLKRLQGLEREKLEAEYQELEKRIAYFQELLSNETMLKGVLKDEMIAIRDKYGDDRRTEIQDVEDEIDIEDLIEEEQCVFTLSHAGYIKRVPASTYRAQRRGGRGVTGQTLREEDFVESVFSASTHDYLLFGTKEIPVRRRAASGSRQNISCGAQTEICRSAALCRVCRVYSNTAIRRTAST